MQVIGALNNSQGELERGHGPGNQLACVAAVGSGELDLGEGAPQVSQQRFGEESSIAPFQVVQTIRSYNAHLSRIQVVTYSELLDSAERALQFEYQNEKLYI